VQAAWCRRFRWLGVSCGCNEHVFAHLNILRAPLGLQLDSSRKVPIVIVNVVTDLTRRSRQATQGGYAFVKVYRETNTARAIYYARYVDWTITTPLLLLDILLLAGLSVGDTLWIVFADIGMIVTGLFGALLPNRYKWGERHFPVTLLAAIQDETSDAQRAGITGGLLLLRYVGRPVLTCLFLMPSQAGSPSAASSWCSSCGACCSRAAAQPSCAQKRCLAFLSSHLGFAG